MQKLNNLAIFFIALFSFTTITVAAEVAIPTDDTQLALEVMRAERAMKQSDRMLGLWNRFRVRLPFARTFTPNTTLAQAASLRNRYKALRNAQWDRQQTRGELSKVSRFWKQYHPEVLSATGAALALAGIGVGVHQYSKHQKNKSAEQERERQELHRLALQAQADAAEHKADQIAHNLVAHGLSANPASRKALAMQVARRHIFAHQAAQGDELSPDQEELAGQRLTRIAAGNEREISSMINQRLHQKRAKLAPAAASRIQAGVRGRFARNEAAARRTALPVLKEGMKELVERRRAAQERHNAAARIQGLARGRQVRRKPLEQLSLEADAGISMADITGAMHSGGALSREDARLRALQEINVRVIAERQSRRGPDALPPVAPGGPTTSMPRQVPAPTAFVPTSTADGLSFAEQPPTTPGSGRNVPGPAAHYMSATNPF